MKKAPHKSTRDKTRTIVHTIFLCILLTILSGVSAILFSVNDLETRGQTPILSNVQQITFTQGHAYATVTTPFETIHTVKVSDLAYTKIADLANHQGQLSIIQTNAGDWRCHHPGESYAFLIMGLIVLIAATLFSCTSFHFISRPVWRLSFPLGLLLLIWGITLHWGAFHWRLTLLLLPLSVAWSILKWRERPKTQRPPSQPIPLLSWKGTLIAFVVGGVFIAVGFLLQYYPLQMAMEMRTALTETQKVTLRPHLTEQKSSSGGKGGSGGTTYYVLASYLDAQQHPHCVVLRNSENAVDTHPMLSHRHRATAKKRFWQLYRKQSVNATLSTKTDTLFLCDPLPEDHLLYNETLSSLHFSHGLRLLSAPFWLFGLILLGGQLLLLTTPAPRRAPLIHRNSLSTHGLHLTLKWIALPTTTLFALWQWYTCYSTFPNLPIYSLTLLALPPLSILIVLGFLYKRRLAQETIAPSLAERRK